MAALLDLHVGRVKRERVIDGRVVERIAPRHRDGPDRPGARRQVGAPVGLAVQEQVRAAGRRVHVVLHALVGVRVLTELFVGREATVFPAPSST